MTDTTATTENHAEQNGRGWLANIAEMMAAYKAAQKREGSFFDQDDEGEDEDAEADEDTSGETADDVRERIEQSPLSVQVRDGWKNPGAESEGPEEFEILLSTGGPALRIIGKLDEHCTPSDVELQHQDWFKPWERLPLTDAERKTVESFCAVFYFGEG